MNFADIRKEYTLQAFDVAQANPDALLQFQKWYAEAEQTLEATAMHLATVSPEGKPSARIVLLKGLDTGFVFFTNYQSRKGQNLLANPYACLTFFWAELERQIRIEGKIEKIDSAISDEYFYSRPLASQIGALVSPQSKVVENREFLEKRFAELSKEYENKAVQRPENWGGYRLIPEQIEFWQGRESRLHDRLLYTKAENSWKIERLAP
ncbi:MAG: pyridoxamine 5'-phosphate oxidase [Bacteroidetes bacterium]|nr:MAG: pyridoxamine 5'-phosphate oxidase [Bacteroidota bacterium]